MKREIERKEKTGRKIISLRSDSIRASMLARSICLTHAAAFVAVCAQVVRDRESARHLARRDVSQTLVHLIGDHTFERQVAVVDDDVERRIAAHRVTVHATRVAYPAISLRAHLIVEGRE